MHRFERFSPADSWMSPSYWNRPWIRTHSLSNHSAQSPSFWCAKQGMLSQDFVKPSDLADQTVLVTEDGCHYRRSFEDTLVSAGVCPLNWLELGSVEAIKRCVLEGIGVAVLPEVAVIDEVAQGRLAVLPWTGCDFSIMTQLAWHKDKWMSPALEAFINVVRAVFRR